MTRDEICNALVQLGHQSKYWGPDQSSYPAFAAGWPAANGPIPTEAEMIAASAAYVAPKPATISYESFQGRFSPDEFNAATDFIYESDLGTGKPKRRAMIQGLSRAMAKNSVDLLDARTVAFLDALVAGGIITAQRKTEILQP